MRDAIAFRGVDASQTVYFSVPRNRLAKTATMKLRYHFSPGLLPTISHINVSLNGTMFATVPVNPAASAVDQGSALESRLTLPPDLLVHDNQLTFQFIGHYATQCEDPTNSTLWSRIDTNSTIELAGSLLPLANDLKAFPLPFYDSGMNPHPAIPIVFLSQPSPKAMQAAGIIASWFGILNGYRPVRFPVSVGYIPPGNAIVIAENPLEIPVSMGISVVVGAHVAMRANPSDPNSSVLVVTGETGDQLVTAAAALTLHGDSWNGPDVPIHSFTPPATRLPNDAPRWLSTERDKVANIGQIAQTGDLQGDGSTPLNIYLRVPPDLDYGEKHNLAFHLSYRYNGVPLGSDSTLQIFMNGAYVSSTPLPHTDNASSVLETVIPIPVVDLRPFSNTLTFKFAFNPVRKTNCEQTAPSNLQGAILKDSYLDLTEIPHSVELPNLELFANAGYPFTRKADLADAAVVLPDQPTNGEIELFLALMGHFGAQTGYPALSVTVTNPAGMTSDAGKDFLVLGSIDDQSPLRTINPDLPVGIDTNGLHIRDARGLLDRATWWRSRGSDKSEPGLLMTGGVLPEAVIEGIEWPSGSNHSVVVVLVRDAAAVPNFISAFQNISQSSDIAQSVSLLHDAQFSSYRLGNDAYRVGEISPLDRATRFLQDYPWLIAFVAIIFCFLMSSLVQAMLRRHARNRLQSTD